MKNNHYYGCGKDIGKRGLTVEVKQVYNNVDSFEKAAELRLKNLDNAIRTLKRTLMQEGVVKEMRDREFYMSKGQKRRKAKKEGIARAMKARRQSEW